MAVFREIRRRARQIAPQALMACLVVYFVYHAVQGERGLLARLRLETELRELKAFSNDLGQERRALEDRVGLLRLDNLDPDMLEERARLLLNYGHGEDLVILSPTIEYEADQN